MTEDQAKYVIRLLRNIALNLFLATLLLGFLTLMQLYVLIRFRS